MVVYGGLGVQNGTENMHLLRKERVEFLNVARNWGD